MICVVRVTQLVTSPWREESCTGGSPQSNVCIRVQGGRPKDVDVVGKWYHRVDKGFVETKMATGYNLRQTTKSIPGLGRKSAQSSPAESYRS